MDNIVIGRKAEIAILKQVLENKQSDLIAVHGRRRVGKTYLVRTVFQKEMVFEMSGIHNDSLDQQLQNFYAFLNKQFKLGKKEQAPTNWLAAFWQLSNAIEKIKTTKKKVIFIDELPWLDTPKSMFISALENFWNSWASKRNDIVLVVCGSAASWIIKNIINNRGGLHNRITRQINLHPFTLKETEDFLHYKKAKLNHYQITQLYMAMGGVPYYLNYVEPGLSTTEIIQAECFTKQGRLTYEFDNLYASLFKNPEKHIEVIMALAKHKSGLQRNDLAKALKISSGGGLTKVLFELQESGFITATIPYQKQKRYVQYKLIDEFTIFYLKFMHNRDIKTINWKVESTTQSYKSWCGFAFESVCLKHIPQIKDALQINGMISYASSWYYKGKSNGAQIDLLLDRNDHTINLFEIKFHSDLYEITKKYAQELKNKIALFSKINNTKKMILLTGLSVYGFTKTINSIGLLDNQITLEKLFKA
jgi:uncharacterized protein